MDETSHTGSIAFPVDCPYTLVLPDGYTPERAWPLVIALHGMGQYEALMKRALAPLADRPWMWLFPRGPYPYEMRGPEKIRIGYAWYLFTGDQDALRRSMAATTTHLLALQDVIRKSHTVGETVLVGFSQGGYQAGVTAANHHERFRGAACIGGRLKHEFMDAPPDARAALALLQLHGGRDANVTPDFARRAVDACKAAGFTDTDMMIDDDAGHEVSPKLVLELGLWLERLFT